MRFSFDDARDYARGVPLVSCPFCREMFEDGEHRTCPLCGVALMPFEKLPPSHDALAEDGVPIAPEHETLAPSYMGRGKGLLAALAIAGLALFFLPWIHETVPEIVSLRGFDLARRTGWSWGAGVAWVVLVPTVLSRRSIAQLRGARVAAAFLSLVPAATVGIFLARPPRGISVGHLFITAHFTYGWPLYATLAVSLIATLISFRLGGRIDDIKVARGSSYGQSVH
jgi:hypothetical protein